MANASLQIGNGNWAIKPSLLLGYNVGTNGYSPIEIGFTRQTLGARTTVAGLIDYKDGGNGRIDYTSGVGSWLLEPQRTNLFLNSVWAGGGSLPTSWVLTSSTGTSTAITSIKNPNVTAYRFVTSTQRVEFSQNISLVLNNVYCLNVYVESVTTAITINNMLRISAITGTGTSVFLKNNVVINGATNIEAGNTYSLQFTVTVADTFTIRVGAGSLGNVTGDFVLSMPQFEQGASSIASYSTSFIPTTTAIATRNADAFSLSNVYTNNYITSAGGTWFVELNNNLSLTRDTGSAGLFLDSTIGGFTNGFSLRSSGGGTIPLSIYKYVATSQTLLFNTTASISKIAIKWIGLPTQTADVFVNGSKVVSGTAFPITNMEYLVGKAEDLPKYIKSNYLFSTPLTDAECIALTT